MSWSLKSTWQIFEWALNKHKALLTNMTSDWTVTFADQVVMALFIKQRCEELLLFDQLSHQLLPFLRIWHFLKKINNAHKWKQVLSIICALQGKQRKFVLKAQVISYLNFLLLQIQAIKYIDFQPCPEIESIHLQSRSPLQPLLKGKYKAYWQLHPGQ